MEKYMEAALGRILFDILFIHARMVDVYLETVMEDVSLGVRVLSAQSIPPKARGKIDCEYKYLLPGFMDPHVHIETSRLNPVEWSKLSIKSGTTSIFCDLMLTGNVYGENTISMFRQLAKQVSARIFYNIPSKVPAYPGKETCGGSIDELAVGRMMSPG